MSRNVGYIPRIPDKFKNIKYYWDRDPDFSAPEMLPNMKTLHKMSLAPAGSFVEKRFDI